MFQPRYGSKDYRHPVVGNLTLGFEAFLPIGDPGQTLGVYTVESGSPSERALQMLARSTAGVAHIQAGQPAEGETDTARSGSK